LHYVQNVDKIRALEKSWSLKSMNFNKILILVSPYLLNVLIPVVKFLQRYDGKIKLEAWDTGWIKMRDTGSFPIKRKIK